MLDVRAVLEGVVCQLLDSNRLSTAATFIRGDDNPRLAVINAVAERLRREAGEDDRVDGTNASACEEGSDGLPGHGHVDRDGVALLHAVGLEDVGEAAHFAEELAERDLAALAGLVCLVDDGRLCGNRSIVDPLSL